MFTFRTAFAAFLLCLFAAAPAGAQTTPEGSTAAPPTAAAPACPDPSGALAAPGAGAEAALQRVIFRYVEQTIAAGCFPCCFCCNEGTCCDECKDNNNLAIEPRAEP
jgi:hypothetical protein